MKIFFYILIFCFISSSNANDVDTEIKHVETMKKERKNTWKYARQQTEISDIIAHKGNTKQKKIWEHLLPLGAQAVIDKGYNLPLPYSFNIALLHTRDTLTFSNLNLTIGSLDFRNLDIEQGIDFGEPMVKTDLMQMRLGAWILPFLQFTTFVNRYQGETELDARIIWGALLSKMCDEGALSGFICTNTEAAVSNLTFNPHFTGYSFGTSMSLAVGFHDYFAVIPVAYTKAKTDDSRTDTNTFYTSFLLGHSFKQNDLGVIAPYIAYRFRNTTGITEQKNISMPSYFYVRDPDDHSRIVRANNISYSLRQRNTFQSSFGFGMNWTLSKNYSISIDGQKGSKDSIYNITCSYRF